MTPLQKTELDILKAFVDVCNKLEIRYFLVCGTALGAVKYGGFIPWDDDVDVGLYREDYELFCNKAQQMLPEYYFLQTYKTDEKYPRIYCKIRDSRTTYIEKSMSQLDINHGVYIDVFPLGGYPKDDAQARLLEKKKRSLELKLSCAFKITSEHSLKARVLLKAERILGLHKRTAQNVKKLDSLLKKWSVAESKLICNHGNWQGVLEYADKSQYGEGVLVDFEGIKVRVPQKYDEYLTQKYGDWRADLPKDQQKGHHYYEIMDVENPYTSYIEKSLSGKVKVKKNI